jgi:hypothetical protein
MEIFRFAVSLRLSHPTITPDEITSELGIRPRHAALKSQGGFYWCSEQESGEDEQLIIAIDKFLDLLTPHGAFLLSYRSTGGTIELFVGWFTSQRSGGAILPADRLAEMGALGVDLSLDVYAPEVNHQTDSG